MTGYGAASALVGGTSLTVEIRSVNQRFLDIKLSLPREYGRWEADLRRLIGEHVARGRVELFVGRSLAAATFSVSLRREVAGAYIRAWKTLKREFKLPGDVDLSLLQGRSDIFNSVDQRRVSRSEVEALKALVEQALVAHAKERTREGAHLRKDMVPRVRALRRVARDLSGYSERLVAELHDKLVQRIAPLVGKTELDPARVAQEAAILADRADVTEELVRLDSHLGALTALMGAEGTLGKRIEFLLQEIGRELNTISSKAGDLKLKERVLDGKVEMEKLREQVQNVE